MADKAIEEQDSLNPVEETVQETETVVDQDVELEPSIEAIIKERDELKEKNAKLYARIKKAEPLKTNSNSDERFERLELKTDGYKDDEIDFLMRNGGKQALKDKLVLSAIEAQRNKIKSQNATPSGTGKSAVYQKFTESDLKNMPLDELEKIIPKE